MKTVREIMTRDAETIAPGESIRRAAQMMDNLNVGALPVCDGRRLSGMVTDRDITVRATAAGLMPDACRVGDVMTSGVEFCFEDDSIEEATERMRSLQVRRLPVVNGQRELVGVVSLGDIASYAADIVEVTDTLQSVSNPSAPDRRGGQRRE